MRLTIASGVVLALATLIMIAGQLALSSTSPYGEIQPYEIDIYIHNPSNDVYVISGGHVIEKEGIRTIVETITTGTSLETNPIPIELPFLVIQNRNNDGILRTEIMSREVLSGNYEIDLEDFENITKIDRENYFSMMQNYDYYGIKQNIALFFTILAIAINIIMMLSHNDSYKERRFVLFNIAAIIIMSSSLFVANIISPNSYIAPTFILGMVPVWLGLIAIYAVLTRDRTNGKSSEQIFE